MATREQKIKFAIKRFKGFWNQFKRSKRGLVGLSIIIFFSIIAIFAPLIAPYEPIEPKISRDEYPGTPGVKIAVQLCKPVWYKYLPWIKRGYTNITEAFYFYGEIQFKFAFIYFVPEAEHPAEGLQQNFEKVHNFSNAMIASHKILEVKEIKAILSSGAHQFNLSEWTVRGSRDVLPIESVLPAEKLLQMCPNATRFELTYTTGVDLTENMKIVNDHKFTKSESFDEWKWASESSGIGVQYDEEHGYVLYTTQKERGCLRVTYTAAGQVSEGDITVTIWKEFNYPYFEPPRDIFIHTSIYKTGNSSIKLQWVFIRENKTFIAAENTVTESGNYKHLYASSFMANTTFIDQTFAAPGNYKFALKLIIPSQSNTTIYLDHVDCLLYGNTFGLLGTDNAKVYPSDLFSTLVYGTRVSLIVGVLTAVFSTFIGLFLGLVSGYVGGIVDEGIMRFTDLLMVLPTLPLFIVLTVSLRAASGFVSMWNLIIILTLFGWMGFARSVRSMVLSLRERAFVEAAKAAGGGRFHIINRHILPNVFALVYITLATSVPSAIVVEASLSWLGLGDPRLASWGKILYDFNSSGIVTTKGLLDYWFWVFPACISIAILAAAFVLVGYALDEILNPRLRERR
ncbi:MAG: ABC transporter permease [Candidatus Bathyarchaeia archaeon]